MTWSWAAFAIDYLIGGVTCAIGAMVLAMGSRGEDEARSEGAPRANPILKFVAGAAPHGEMPTIPGGKGSRKGKNRPS